MPDPRFARLRSDPRFRSLKRHKNKVTVDNRFSSVFSPAKKHSKTRRVDKYGRPLSDAPENENLRRFYRLDPENQLDPPTGPDYARGEVLLESSDEEEGSRASDPAQSSDDGNDDDGVVTLGPDVDKPIAVPQGDDAEVDLDEDDFADMDTRASLHRKASDDDQDGSPMTRRLAVVDMDWDHVRAAHLYKIFISAIAPAGPSSSSVRIFPSKFGLERMAREENGPPSELLKNQSINDEEDVNERTIFETGDADEYDEDALRRYQLQRMRYFYAVVECDSVELASYLYSELQGAELERSANILNLSFVPDDMTFEEECRLGRPISPLTCETFISILIYAQALRHSKVRLTWDQDDPERDRVTRRPLSLKEIEENDFRAYLASSTDSSSEDETKSKKKAVDRDKLRVLLLGGGGNDLPEGWAGSKTGDMDEKVTFRPALSGGNEEETTIGKYHAKCEKNGSNASRNRRTKEGTNHPWTNFLLKVRKRKIATTSPFARGQKQDGEQRSKTRKPSTREELSLLVAPDRPDSQAKHFDMAAIIKAEKSKGRRHKGRGKKTSRNDENELQDDFAIDVKDERFKALHEDHSFAIDPSNPQKIETEECPRRARTGAQISKNETRQSLASLVESVKRKRAVIDNGDAKRQKL
ncbi:hypothetical protein BC826DRAFT_1088909 [Russula brevipes]|nr:hypothetical protein BC826DRAFT_1088909 [Russula brevipes]